MLDKTLPLLAIFLIGFGFKKLNVVQKEDGRILSKLLMLLLIPATIIHAIATAVIAPRLLLLPLAGIIVVLILLGIGFFLAPLLGLRGGTKGAFLVSFPTMECGSIGYAVMAAAYGTAGLTAIVLFDLGHALLFFLLIPVLASLFGQGEHMRLRTALKQLISTPLLWAFAIGVVLNISHLHLPLLSNLLSMVTASLLFLIMFLVGLEFEWSFSSLVLPGLAMYLKMGIGMSVGVLVSLLFGFSGVERIAVVLAASLPASLLTVIVAKENQLDGQFVASMLSIALPVSIAVSLLFTVVPH